MKKAKIIGLLLVLLIGLSLNNFAVNNEAGANVALTKDEFSLEEMLKYALEDERMAQAEYSAIMEKFNVTRPFSNIEKAEVRHEEAVINLYEARNLEIPSFDGNEHVILPETIEEIYDIGIKAEINNIAMYEKFLSQDLDKDVRAVFEALRDGSINHLEAFKRADEGNRGNNGLKNGNSKNRRNGF